MKLSLSKRKSFVRALGLFLSVIMLMSVVPAGIITVSAAVPCEMILSDASGSTNRYLTTRDSNAFNVIMYNSVFSGVFGDQHMSGIEFFLHGYRIATNGDVHYLPTPEQWDATPAPSRGTKVINTTANSITVPMTLTPGSPEPVLRYELVGAPNPNGGATLSVRLLTDLSPDLAGKARFNLEFIPSKYREKTYMVDTTGNGKYDDFGIFPFHPQDEMELTKRPNMPGSAWYVKDWDKDRGDSQPVPFAEGYKFTLAPEDEFNNISITSNTGRMEMFDGRNRSQNGWFVLSELLTGGKAGDIIVSWDILPKVKEGWVRDPNIGFSQAGYDADAEKFAVMELDKYDVNYTPAASLVRVNADGTKEVVYTANLTTPATSATWQRFIYRRFTFTDIKEKGMYFIRYGNQDTEVFPIDDTVYDRSWQIALSSFLAVQMDHVEVREGTRLWHAASHMEDGTLPGGANYQRSYFDGQSTPATMPPDIAAKGFAWDDFIQRINVGGWFDAGDFDLAASRHTTVTHDLVNAAVAFDNLFGFDEMAVTWDDYKTGGTVEIHKPDGIPDVVQQIRQGVAWILANYEELGHYAGTMEVRSLRQYTHLGDASTDTDGWIYDKNLGPNEIVERDGVVYSGIPDDRQMMTIGTTSTTYTGNNTALLAGAAYLLADYYPDVAQRCLNAVLTMWDRERATAAANFSTEWNTLVHLMLATNKFGMTERFNYFKARLQGLATTTNLTAASMSSRFNACFIMDLMDDAYRTLVGNAVRSHTTSTYTNYPYGVQFTTGATWGGSPTIITFGQYQAILYRYFPDVAGLKTNVLRAANYILGTHPITNNSWLSGFGTKSHVHPYNSNRADEGYIPGSILPGHITVSPDIVESLDDFSFLWFENESCIDYQSKWIAVGLGASMIANESKGTLLGTSKDFSNSFMMSIKSTGAGDGYLTTPGFDAYMFNNTYDAAYGDQKAAGLELIQSGRRIATNGDISLLPTQNQWYANSTAQLKNRVVDSATNSLTANLAIPADSKGNPAVNYSLKAEPEPGGIKLTVKLDAPLPADLAGKAGFNLEFIPSQYTSKSYQVDTNGDGAYDAFSVFQISPSSPMEEEDAVRTADQPDYIKAYDAAKGGYQPLPLASGKKITLAAEDDENRIRVTSDSGNVSIYDGRDLSTNGWFVLRTVFAAGQTEIVWHINPDVKPGWTRKPNVAYNQAGYEPDLAKVAVIELDPNYNAPATAYVDRVNDDGTYTEVFSGSLGTATTWSRYQYRNFDFSAVRQPGLYVLRYAGERSEVFPILRGSYNKTWKATLNGFFPIQMDHMTVRESYKIWSLQAHLDDAIQAPLNYNLYENWSMGAETDSKYPAYQHINGLNIGGWYDSGDFNLKTDSNLSAILDLALAYDEFDITYDGTYIDWDAKFTELKKNDSVPDIVQQVQHGISQILGQIENVGYAFPGLAVPTLWQYAASGDGSRLTDRRNYDSTLAPNARYGLRSGVLDDRLAFAGKKDATLQYKAAAALAAAAYTLEAYDEDLAERCLKAAEKIWDTEQRIKVTPSEVAISPAAYAQVGAQWNAAVQLLLARGGEGQAYINYLKSDANVALQANKFAFGADGWKAVRVLKYMDADFNGVFGASVDAYVAVLDSELASNPFGVPTTDSFVGGNAQIVDMGVRMSILNKYLPGSVGTKYTINVADYILGKHMYNNSSWVAGVGNKFVHLGYGGNRADNYYVVGGVSQGYSSVLPEFAEALDDYSFLRSENEYAIETAAKWIVVANAAARIAGEDLLATGDIAGQKVNVRLTNHASTAVSGTAYAAVYDADGKMVLYLSLPFTVQGNGRVWNGTFNIDMNEYPDCTCKIFFWDPDYIPVTAPVLLS